MTDSRTYAVAPFGYGPQFPDSERPPTYASQMRNRFVNPGGGAEVRRGLTQIGDTIANVSAPDLNRLHELVEAGGTATLLVSGSAAAQGRIWKLDTSAGSTWTQVYASADASARFHSVQFDDKLILGNGVNRNIFTTDASAFDELVPLILQGEAEATATAHDKLLDDKVLDWVGDTDININDLLFDVTTSAYAIITDVASSQLTHQPLTAASPGLMSGNAAKSGGDKYEIHDLVELNIIPAAQEPDNLAIGGIGTSATRVRVSAEQQGINVDFDNTEVRVGDFIRNTTRNAVARITKVSAFDLEHTSITNQTVGDSLVFFKYAMPLSDRLHAHYGRMYYNDTRDRRKVRISSPADPQDLTTDAATLDATTFKLGAQSPGADELVSMASFQQYFVFGGKRTIWLFSGTDPIADTSGAAIDFSPQSQFPEGLASPDSLITIGNDIVWLSPDGMRSAALEGSQNLPTRENLSDSLRDELQSEVSGASSLEIINYPRRHWVFTKVSNTLYVFNYSPNLAGLAHGEIQDIPGQRGSWSVFDGDFAGMNDYFVRANADMLCCDASGRVYRFDDEGVYTDGAVSAKYTTQYQTAWLGLDEFRNIGRPTRMTKKTVSLLPTIQVSADATYQISVSAPYDNESGESVTHIVSASGKPVHTPRLPLVARGERVRFDYQTTAAGHDVLGHQTVLYNRYGTRRVG